MKKLNRNFYIYILTHIMEERIERFLEFIRQKGGASAVGKRIGKHPQFVYNIEQGKGKPNFETLAVMKEAYQDLDLNWIFTEKKTEVSTDQREVEFLKRENTLYRAALTKEGYDLSGKCKGVTVNSPKLIPLKSRNGSLTLYPTLNLLGQYAAAA